MKKDLVLKFDPEVVNATSVQKACYRFMERVSSDVRITGEDVVCSFEFKDTAEVSFRSTFEMKFREEVLDNGLREKISSETENLRTLVLGLAFSQSGIQDDEV